MQPIFEFGGEGTIVNLAIANGFPPQTYQPLLQPLTDSYRVVSLPPRALWPDESPPKELLQWDKTLVVDLLNGLRGHNLQGVIAIGHSFGGIASMLAAIEEPTRFKALILLDPTILPRYILWAIRFMRFIGSDRGNFLAHRAEKRRTHFESLDAAFEYFKGKRLFSDWPDETIRYYVETFIPDGDEVRLSWPRAWEAYYFRTLYTESWRQVPKLAKTGLPILLIRGGTSDTLLPQSAQSIVKALPNVTYHEIEGHGHLFPQSAPDETCEIIVEWLANLGL